MNLDLMANGSDSLTCCDLQCSNLYSKFKKKNQEKKFVPNKNWFSIDSVGQQQRDSSSNVSWHGYRSSLWHNRGSENNLCKKNICSSGGKCFLLHYL